MVLLLSSSAAFICIVIVAFILFTLNANTETGFDWGGTPFVGPVAGNEIPGNAIVAKTLNDFKGVDNSKVFPQNKGHPEITNITDKGNGVFEFYLRHRGSWYDGDRDLAWNRQGYDKSRAEVTQLGSKAQQVGETWEYGTTFKVDKDFSPATGFCNVMQQFPMSWIQLMKIKGETITGSLMYAKTMNGFHPHASARNFTFRRNEWVSLVIRLKIDDNDGECALSVNGDEFKGVRGRVLKSDKSYGAKWGLYMSATKDVNGKPLGDSKVWHANVWVRQVS